MPTDLLSVFASVVPALVSFLAVRVLPLLRAARAASAAFFFSRDWMRLRAASASRAASFSRLASQPTGSQSPGQAHLAFLFVHLQPPVSSWKQPHAFSSSAAAT